MKKNPYFSLVNCLNVKPKHVNVLSMITFALLMQVFSLNVLHAQNAEEITVKGKIVDLKGEPLIGVNIVPEKSTSMGTITDMDGNFTIKVPADDVLKVTYIGFKEQSIPVDGRVIVNINMEEGTSDLDEVVVVGYGSVKRANLVGSVSSIKAEELEDYPVTSLTSLLDGRMSGVSVSPSQPSGRPGAQTRIVIRGDNTFGSAGGGAKEANPLYVVDGFILSQEEFDVLDPNEVESISVLKDASAAVYGARGSNGVILVQTKRGTAGKMRISYSGSLGVGDATQQTDMLSAYNHARLVNYEKGFTDSNYENNKFTDNELDAMKSLDYDWLEDAWKANTTERHSVSLSGGNEKLTYFGSGTYIKEGGNFDNLSVTKYSYRLGLDAKLTDELKASVTLSIDNKDDKMPYVQTSGVNTMENVFKQLLQTPKWYPHHINGNPVGVGPDEIIEFNTFALFDSNSYKKKQSKGNTLNLALNYDLKKITKGLSTNLTYSRRENHGYTKQYRVPYYLYNYEIAEGGNHLLSDKVISIDKTTNSDRIYESYGYNQNYQLNASLTYERIFGLHDVKLFATYEQSESSGFDFAAYAYNQKLNGIETQTAFNSDGSATTDGYLNQAGNYSVISRLNYSYADKYILESAFRFENSANISPSERGGVFPSLALGWIASEEAFIKDNLYFVDFLKFRGSYGRTGRDYLKAFEYLLQFSPDNSSYYFANGTQSGVSAQNYGVVSNGVTWEKTDMSNFGVDLKLFDQKVGITFDTFYEYSYDILDQSTDDIPSYMGIEKMVSRNIGRMESWGYDMEISYNGKVGKDFKWNVKGLFVYNTNRILEATTQYGENDFRYPIGRSSYATSGEQGYVTNGIIRTQEQIDAINAENQAKYGRDYEAFGGPAQLGMLYFQDIARPGNSDEGEPEVVYEPDGIVQKDVDVKYITEYNDKLIWKNLLPSTVSVGASWKNISMKMQFNMAYGTYSSIYDKLARTGPTLNENAPNYWGDSWTEDNVNAEYPSVRWSSLNKEASSFWVRDVYQLRLRTLDLSYTLPNELVQRWGFGNVRVFFSGTNLWTPISTFDYKEDAISRYNTYPFLKTYNFGLNVSL